MKIRHLKLKCAPNQKQKINKNLKKVSCYSDDNLKIIKKV